MAQPPTYGYHRPYAEPPARLSDLAGPDTGVVCVPVTIDWGPARTYDLDVDRDRRILYERVLREAATTAEICDWVNGAALVQVWKQLWLPERLRRRWEETLPALLKSAA